MLKKVLLAAAFLALASVADAQNSGRIQTLSGSTITVTAAPTLIVSPRDRNAVTLSNPSGGVTVYLSSNSAVTTATGFPLATGQALTLQPFNGPVYGIVASGTQSFYEAETY